MISNAIELREEDKHCQQPSAIRNQLHDSLDEWFDEYGDELEHNWNPRSAMELLNTEKFVWKAVLVFGGTIMALILNAVSNDVAFRRESNRQFRQLNPGGWKSKNSKPVRVQTRFGNWVKVKTSHLYPKKRKRGPRSNKKNGSSHRPTLIQMGLTEFVTPFLGSEMARETTEGPSYAAAVERFVRQGFRLSKQRLRRITKSFSDRTGQFLKAILSGAGNSLFPSAAGKLVEVEVDGGRVKLSRKKRGKRKKGAKRAGRKTTWREPCLILIKLVDPITNEVHKVYDATLQSWKQTFRLLESYLRCMKIELAEEIQFICDGARHLWRWDGAAAMFERLKVGDRVNYTLDFYHATQRIWAIANLIKSWKDDKARKKWAHSMIGYLRKGDVDRVIEAIRGFCRGRNAGVIKSKLQYLIDHKEHLNYAELEEKGLALGSGEVESAMRRVVNQRLKGNGTLWTGEMVEGMLTLRCYLKAGWWEKLEESVTAEGQLWRV